MMEITNAWDIYKISKDHELEGLESVSLLISYQETLDPFEGLRFGHTSVMIYLCSNEINN